MASIDGEYVGPLEEEDCARIVADVKAGRPVLEQKQLRNLKAAGSPGGGVAGRAAAEREADDGA